MRYVFIINPSAGGSNSEKQIRQQIERLPEKDDCLIHVTTGSEDARNFVKETCQKGQDEKFLFIACGGDGTLNAVANGVAGNDNAMLSVYPCGSGNDFVKAVGGQEAYLDISRIIHGTPKKTDLLKVNDLYADNAIHFGFDTAVAMTVNEGRAKRGNAGKFLYVKGIIKALTTSMRNRFKVYADGELLDENGEALLCTLCNGQYVGGSFRSAPRSKYDDGLIEVCLVKPVSIFRFIRLISVYVKGEHLDDESLKDIVVYRQSRQVKVEAPEGFAFSLDGEIIYENNFTVDVKNKAIDFVFPAK